MPHGTGLVGRRCNVLSNGGLVPHIPVVTLYTDSLVPWYSIGIGKNSARLQETGDPWRVDQERAGMTHGPVRAGVCPTDGEQEREQEQEPEQEQEQEQEQF